MNRSYLDENDASRARVQAFVASLSDEDMTRQVGAHWTVGTGLMHLAFWDRQWLAKLEEWERTGVVVVPPLRDVINGINDGMLPWWRSIAPAQVRHEVVAAAEAMDAKVASLPQHLLEAILADRPRTLIRATHRREHLGEIERALVP
jgi:uncharacterized damage-inducible protein DinB